MQGKEKPKKGLQCPNCGQLKSAGVRQTRDAFNAIARERRCTKCGRKFMTLEEISLQRPLLLVCKESGERVAWNDAVLEREVRVALGKNYIEEGEIREIVQSIFWKAVEIAGAINSTYVTTHELDDIILKIFASNHRDPRYVQAWCYVAADVLQRRHPRALEQVVERVHTRPRTS